MRKTALIFLLFGLACFSAFAQKVYGGKVLDAQTGDPLPGAAVTQGKNWALTDSIGNFQLKTNENLPITITCLGYKTLRAKLVQGAVYKLDLDILAIQEVVVTARENRGFSSASKIGADAIAHIQPSSFADVLELLPGGLSRDPALGSPQIVNLRAAGNLSADYATSALGTQFTIDGKPLGNNANLQYSPAFSNLDSDYVNLGTDMRTITTEDIEEVEVVRGIASVAHGDLTSGLVQIQRKRGGNGIRLRFKSDMKSKLLYAGKDWEWGGKDRRTLNVSANYLDSHADPRNTRQNYRRITGSVRGGRTWTEGREYKQTLNLSLDYTGSFDTRKSDQDLDQVDGNPIETYSSSYNRLSAGADYQLTAKDENLFFRSLSVMASLSYEKDLIDRWRTVINSTETPFSISREPGEFDAVLIPTRYESTLQVDGQPFYAYIQSIAHFQKGIWKWMAGAEWNYDKNFGRGTVFDLLHPFSTSMSARPRAYSDIPASSQLAVFLQENSTLPLGAWALEWSLGLRASLLLGADKTYAVQAKPYLDPRANLRLVFPAFFPGGYKLEGGLYTGIGLHSKFPTMDMLYPAPAYGDRQQLNYWPAERELRRINMLVYRIDPTNKALEAARNLKWEIGADAAWNGWSVSADFFLEDMTSGFRGGSEYMRLISKDYDEQSIDKSSLTGPPSLETTPYRLDTALVAYGTSTNGSRTLKEGVEFTLTTCRFPVVNTRATLSGAWFLTRYMNSQPEYERPSVVIDGALYPYIGIYDKNDSNLYESLSTNLLLDTQAPRLGLVFTTSFQTTWFTARQSFADDSHPVAYLDKNLERHPFTEASAADPVLRRLVREFSPALLDYRRVPFLMNINLKVSKKLYRDKATFSLFVNRLFTVAPDYEVGGVLKRRSSSPYFGMELSFKL